MAATMPIYGLGYIRSDLVTKLCHAASTKPVAMTAYKSSLQLYLAIQLCTQVRSLLPDAEGAHTLCAVEVLLAPM